MEWNIMEPGGSAATGLGCFVGELYIPSDDCEDVLDEVLEMLSREDPKLRNGRRRLFSEKIIERDLVPLIMCCTDEDIIGRTVRLLANLTQPLQVFLQQQVPLGQQCQREITALVSAAKIRCTDLEFFKSLHNRMEMAMKRGGDKVLPSDSEMLNHSLLLLRNLLHTSPEDCQTSEASITLQSMISSFFLSEMDKLVLRLLNHPQKADWVVSNVQLLSLVFKDYAGVLLEEEDDDKEGDCESMSDVFEFTPSQTAKILSNSFDKQLQLGVVPAPSSSLSEGRDRAEQRHSLDNSDDDVDSQEAFLGALSQGGDADTDQSSVEQDMQVEEEEEVDGEDEDGGDDEDGDDSDRDKSEMKSEDTPAEAGPLRRLKEEASALGQLGKKGKNPLGRTVSEQGMFTYHEPNEKKAGQAGRMTDSDSGLPGSNDSERQGGDTPPEEVEVEGDKDSGVDDYAAMLWDNLEMGIKKREEEVLSELSTGSCLMDRDIIVAYLRKFASDIVCSGLSNMVQCLMKVLMSSYEGVLDDSFFMWTVGFFLSFAKHSHIEFFQYRDLLNLDVFGFLVYQGYRNCETLACQMEKQENCSLVKYRLHLVVCTLNQLFQVILNCNKETNDEGDYIHTLQKCLAQMGDLQRLFILLIRWYQSPAQDLVFLRDLVHTNHHYLLLLEEWGSRGYLPRHFSMLSHITQYATFDVMQKYGSLLELYTNNAQSLNVSIMTMMYHIAGDCNRADVLLQLPILKTFSEIWGDMTCNKYVEFNDLIEFILESFMGLAFRDPVMCAQKLFEMSPPVCPSKQVDSSYETVQAVGSLTDQEQDWLFTWITDLQGSVNMVDDLVQRLHSRGSTASRQQVVLHLLQNGWLEEKQLEALSEEIKELQDLAGTDRNQMSSELSALTQDELLPFLLTKLQTKGLGDQLHWLQDQLLEAAYVRLGVRDSKYRVHVEEPLARFYALQDKSIPLVMVNEEEEKAVRDPYFTELLQALGLFAADSMSSCVFCRIPHFLSPAELVKKAQQLGDIDLGQMKFDLNEVQDDLSYMEFTPLFKTYHSSGPNESDRVDFSRPTVMSQGHQWFNVVRHFNQSKEVFQTQT